MKSLNYFLCILLTLTVSSAGAQTITKLESGWKFAFGNASNPEKDWGHGTEYFNYLTKAHSIHNQGPYTETFDDSTWQDVTVPHDWVATLPYQKDASHSHGYKTVGWKYPETSVGWYRKKLDFTKEQEGRHFTLRFDGIFRNATVWFNGFYLGTEPSGYAVQTYDITPYINFDGGPNVLCVRADASLEEGWYYEGAGIYRNAYLIETSGTSTNKVTTRILDAEGNILTGEPHLWSPEDPYLYTRETTIGEDVFTTRVGFRTAEFTADEGFLLNGKKYTLKGVNLHQDHAGVGSAMPDGLIRWRVRQLKKLGVNAIRSSHNPASPALMDICDQEGMLLIDENRLMGTNDYHKRLLKNMVEYGKDHPCVILWSVGNEEWGLENDIRGIKIVQEMQDYVHSLDSTRQTTAANAGGASLIQGLQVQGYNYIVQNDVENRHRNHPEWITYGSEETTGCGTRGIYYPEEGRMPSINRTGEPENVIERGWQYYRDNAWTGGVFWWTGFDYRGEPNPLEYPAHDSQFGILDYCGFPKDEAWYLKAAWTDEPVVHILPHWNLQGHEGETIDVWVYSNCDQIQLSVNGKNFGRKTMPKDGHLSWKVPYRQGKVIAKGYKNGRQVAQETIQTTGPAVKAAFTSETVDNITIVNVTLLDEKGRAVPDACNDVTLTINGEGRILGAGNGDPKNMAPDNAGAIDCKCFTFPAFNGHAQFILQDIGSLPDVSLSAVNHCR